MPDRRAIITTTPEELLLALGLRGHLLHVEHNHTRQLVELVIAAEDLDPVEPFAEVPVVLADRLRLAGSALTLEEGAASVESPRCLHSRHVARCVDCGAEPLEGLR